MDVGKSAFENEKLRAMRLLVNNSNINYWLKHASSWKGDLKDIENCSYKEKRVTP